MSPVANHQSGLVTAKDGEQWYVLNLPMEAEEADPLERKPGEILWPWPRLRLIG